MSAEIPKKPSKFTRIFALGEERVTALNNMLARGTPVMQVARHIQKNWGQFLDVNEKTLTQQISRYKLKHVVSQVTVEEEILPATAPKRQALKGKLNTLEEMELLYEIQYKRLSIAVEREGTIKMLMKGTGAEVIILQNMLEKIQKLRFDLGLDVYQGPALSGSRQTITRFDPATGQVTLGVKEDVFTTAASILENYQKKHQPQVLEHEPDPFFGEPDDRI